MTPSVLERLENLGEKERKGKGILGTFNILLVGAFGRVSYSKHRAARVLLLLLYYWIVLSRPLYYFLVLLKGKEFAGQFQLRVRTYGYAGVRLGTT